MSEFYQRFLRQAPKQTGIPETPIIQVEERNIVSGKFRDDTPPASPQDLDDQVTAPPTPTITKIVPDSGTIAGGTSVTIDGTDFIPETIVKYGGVIEGPGGLFVDATRIISTTPAHGAGQVDVDVINADPDIKATKTNGYEFLSNPAISSVSPGYGDIGGGTVIDIFGSGFVNGCTADVSGSAVSGLTFINAGHLRGTTSAKSEGFFGVHIRNPSGQEITGGSFHYQHIPGGFGFDPSNPFNALSIPNNSHNILSVYPTLTNTTAGDPPPWSQYIPFEGVIRFSVYRSVGVDITFTPADGLVTIVNGRATCQFSVHTPFISGGSIQIQVSPVDYPSLLRTSQYLVNP